MESSGTSIKGAQKGPGRPSSEDRAQVPFVDRLPGLPLAANLKPLFGVLRPVKKLMWFSCCRDRLSKG